MIKYAHMFISALIGLTLLGSNDCFGAEGSLIYKQKVDGKVYSFYFHGRSSFMISGNEGCRGFGLQCLEHETPNEVKVKITHLWDIPATFEGDTRPEAVKAMVGKTYIFNVKDEEIVSIKEVVPDACDATIPGIIPGMN